MATDGPELLALALSLEAEDVADEEAVASLVESAGGSATALMGAYAFALSLARDMPYDTSHERTLGLLTRALQRAVRMSGEHQPPDDAATLLRHIVEVSGQASVGPGAVASRSAELDADIDHLRSPGDERTDPAPA